MIVDDHTKLFFSADIEVFFDSHIFRVYQRIFVIVSTGEYEVSCLDECLYEILSIDFYRSEAVLVVFESGKVA